MDCCVISSFALAMLLLFDAKQCVTHSSPDYGDDSVNGAGPDEAKKKEAFSSLHFSPRLSDSRASLVSASLHFFPRLSFPALRREEFFFFH